MYPLGVTPYLLPTSQPLETTNLQMLCAVSLDLFSLDISFEWNYVIYDLLGLTSLSWHNVSKVHPHCSSHQYLIPFNAWIIFHHINIVHLFFTIYRLRGLWVVATFCLLLIMLLSVFTCKVLGRCMFLFLLSIYLEVELLGQMISLCLTFWGNVKLFSKLAASVHSQDKLSGLYIHGLVLKIKF